MMGKFEPKSIDDIGAEWLSNILRTDSTFSDSSIINIKREQIAKEKAWLSSIYKVELEHDSLNHNLPNSLVIKLLLESHGNRDASYELDAYKREIMFYEQIAPNFPVRLPKLYYTNNKNLIIMEDLSYMTPGDQILGMNKGQVFQTLEALAKVHASFWNNQTLNNYTWLPTTNKIHLDYQQNWDSFVELCGSFIDPKGLYIGEKLKENVPWLLDRIGRRPITLVHDDMKADNLLFDISKTNEAVVILDWQFAIKSMGAIDVARLIGGSWNLSDRAGNQIDALRHWYENLLNAGVGDYSWPSAQEDFKLAALYCLFFPVHFHRGIKRAQGRALEYIKILYSGLFDLAVEIEAESVLL